MPRAGETWPIRNPVFEPPVAAPEDVNRAQHQDSRFEIQDSGFKIQDSKRHSVSGFFFFKTLPRPPPFFFPLGFFPLPFFFVHGHQVGHITPSRTHITRHASGGLALRTA